MTRKNAKKELKRMKTDKSHTGAEYNALMTAIRSMDAIDEFIAECQSMINLPLESWEQVIELSKKHFREDKE